VSEESRKNVNNPLFEHLKKEVFEIGGRRGGKMKTQKI
jgi:hypothetical protein